MIGAEKKEKILQLKSTLNQRNLREIFKKKSTVEEQNGNSKCSVSRGIIPVVEVLLRFQPGLYILIHFE
jgi:hypothetical protein